MGATAEVVLRAVDPREAGTGGDGSSVYAVETNGRRAGVVRVALDRRGNANTALASGCAAVATVVDPMILAGRAGASGLVRAIVDEARRVGASSMILETCDLLVRHEARLAGFTGELHSPLAATFPEVATMPALSVFAADDADPPTRAARLTDVVQTFGIPVGAATPVGAMSRLSRRITHRVGDMLDIGVDWRPGRTVDIAVPDAPDVMPESVALAAATMFSVLDRFAAFAGAVKSVSFDRSSSGLERGKHSGEANTREWGAHITSRYVLAGSFPDSARAAVTANVGVPPVGAGGPGPRTRPVSVVEATVAHEVWHLIDGYFQLSAVRASMEMKRQLGLVVGVDTIGRVFHGQEARAPSAYRAAFEALRDQVSPYATTNMDEAMAELFTAWWCRSGETSPLVTRFGELVDEMLPPTTV